MNKSSPIWQNLQRFANEHKVILEDKGKVRFGRPCVGFLRKGLYIAFDPHKHPNYDRVWPEDQRLLPPSVATDAYHKHDCFAILVHGDDYDKALAQLNAWVEYETGATGFQAIMSGLAAYAFRFVEEES